MDTKHTHPKYLTADDVDALARQNVQLMTELWITRDRLFLLEHLLEKQGLIDRKVFDNSVPDDDLAHELDAERAAFIKRIMGVTPEDRTVEKLKDMAPTRKATADDD